ncbi:MAG: ribonuclease P protein component [Candidatus Doudnabacteria bacterium]|nr:ribonuclease P protein component [Candidatus Doudnabacteria bacterium]
MGRLKIIKQEKDFRQFRSGKSFQGPVLRIRIKSANQNTPRFGFIIPKKTVPKVTQRNKIKRRLKSILTNNLDFIKPVDVLLFPGAIAGKKKFRELEKQTVDLFKKAGIWTSSVN